VAVALLSLPSIADTNCGRLQLDAAIALSEDALRGLLGALQTKDESLHARIRRRADGEGNTAVFLEERFGIDVLTGEERRAHVVEVLGGAEGAPGPAGLLHLDVDVFLDDKRSPAPVRTDEQESVSRLWEWATQHPLEAHVRAWMMYEPTERRSIINLPLPVPGDISAFDAIPGLWLVKRDPSGSAERTLYEVSLRQESDGLALFIHFRALLDGGQDMLGSLLARAQQIASFAAPETNTPKPADS